MNTVGIPATGLGGAAHTAPPLDLLGPTGTTSRQVLLWIIDGLGFDYLRAHPQAVHLNRNLRGSMTSVYPPTTTSAITTLLTGMAPQQHGLTGWHMYFRELGSILAILPGKPRYGGVGLGAAGIDTAKLLGHVAFADRIGVETCTISPAGIAGSDFNLAHLGRARLTGYRGLDGLLDAIDAVLHEDGRRFVHAYWPELDSIGHREGIGSEASSHLQELDRAFKTSWKGSGAPTRWSSCSPITARSTVRRRAASASMGIPNCTRCLPCHCAANHALYLLPATRLRTGLRQLRGIRRGRNSAQLYRVTPARSSLVRARGTAPGTGAADR